jgi:hypothetical protein
MDPSGKRARRDRAAGMAHRLWWLAAVMGVVVGLGIVLDTPSDSRSERTEAPTAVARDVAATARGG